jgi:hypothetical protein
MASSSASGPDLRESDRAQVVSAVLESLSSFALKRALRDDILKGVPVALESPKALVNFLLARARDSGESGPAGAGSSSAPAVNPAARGRQADRATARVTAALHSLLDEAHHAILGVEVAAWGTQTHGFSSSSARAPPLPAVVEPLDSLRKSRDRWDKFVCAELSAVTLLRGCALVRPRNDADEDLSMLRHIYDASTLLEAVVSVVSPNLAQGPYSKVPSWSLVAVELETRSVAELRRAMPELRPQRRQVGLDEDVVEGWAEERLRSGARLAESGSAAECQRYARSGVPVSVRPRLFTRILSAGLGEREAAHFDKLYKDVEEWEFVTDELVRMDISENAMDEQYFLFEEVVEDVLLAMSRDPWFLKALRCPPHSPPVGRSTRNPNVSSVFPISGVLPFRGMSLYVAPLCYLFAHAEEVYFLFRELYSRYFSKLHGLSSDPNGLLSLCKQFEALTQEKNPEVYFHLLNLRVHPLRIAFRWLVYAFSGYLAVDQVLVLWDRVVGFNSTTVLAILAAAIFSFRADSLLEAQTVDAVHAVFEDASNLKVVPLLQHFLFVS